MPYHIQASVVWPGLLNVFLNDSALIQNKLKHVILGTLFKFEHSSHVFEVRVKGFGFLGKLQLLVDGHDVELAYQPPIRPQPGIPVVSQLFIQEGKLRTPSGSEVIHVPEGVHVNFRRSRTVEHTVVVEMRHIARASLEVPLISELLRVGIHAEVERLHQRSYVEIEAVDYEIDLDGGKNLVYELRWSDLWLVGHAQINDGYEDARIPFRFREGAELQVIPGR